MVKRGTTIRAFKITINYQKINQQFNINSDRLVKSAFWQPTLSCQQKLQRKKNCIQFSDKASCFWWFDTRKLDEEEATDTRINNPKYTIKDRKDTEVVLPLKQLN